MRQYLLTEFGGDLEARDADDPVPVGREVLVRVRRCGVCHSDLHLQGGYFDLGGGERFMMASRGMELPMALGHEVLGEVISAGPEAGDVELGKTMLVHPWIGCMECDACRDGRENDCTKMSAIGIVRDGGFGTHLIVPGAEFLVDIGDIDPSIAAPLACSGLTVYSALKKVLPVRRKEWLAVIGAGGLGLSAVTIARAMGVENVIAVDIDDDKLAAAQAQGAVATVNSGTQDAAEQLVSAANGELIGVLDTVGMEATTGLAVAALRKTGRLVIVGLHGGEFRMPLPYFPQKALTVRGSYVGSVAELRELVALVQAGKVKPIPVETRPMAMADRTLKDLASGKVVGRVVLSTEA